jgi:ABC-2 type transport system permease protein
VQEKFAVEPLALSFFSDERFYLHLILVVGDTIENIFLQPDMTSAEVRTEVEAALKRSSSGFLKTIGIWTPPTQAPQFGIPQALPESQYSAIRGVLRENYNLEDVDLTTGHVPGDVDVLLLVGPQQMSDLERFAVDQHLMRGGSVVALAGNYVLDLQPGMQSLNLKKVENGIADLLRHYGVTVEDALVMDAQNEPFPIPVSRDIGGLVIQEIRQLDYPFFVDVRREGMTAENPISATLDAVTMNWVSPVTLLDRLPENLKASVLLHSSPESWLHYGTEIQPDFQRYPQYGFPGGEELQSRVLAVTMQGTLSSYFSDREDPRRGLTKPSVSEEKEREEAASDAQPLVSAPINSVIRKTASARLVVVGSAEFVSDAVISISQSVGQDRFMNGLEFLQNAIDWAVEDEGLLAIRSRGSHTRLLYPLNRREQVFWEALNYGIALLALVLVSYYGIRRRWKEVPIVIAGLSQVDADKDI